MILSVCDNPDVLSVMRIINIVITIIKIVVPILLIVKCMLDYASAIKDNDSDALSKTNKIIVKRVIAAILVFIIPTFITLIANITENKVSYSSCLTSATKEGISNAYKQTALKYIDYAKSTLNENDYKTASNYVKSKIKDESNKNELNELLKTIKSYIDIKNDMISLKTKFDLDKYNKIKGQIEAIKDKDVKAKLESMFKKIVVPIEGDPNGKKEKSTVMTYVVHAPSMVVPGMPLVLYLHGDGGGNASGSSPFLNATKKYFGDNLPYILVTPNGGMWAETNGRLSELKSIIDKECEKYKCNKDRISIAGHSRGSIGTWHMINSFPGVFYSAIPVSCGSYNINPSNFVKTKIRAYAGNSGEAEARYNREMSRNVRHIQDVGGNATFTSLNGAGHGDTPALAFTKENLEWMIK